MSFTPLFASRGSWLLVVGGLIAIVFVAWFLFRVIVDTVGWFREEIIEDYQHRKTKDQQAQEPRDRSLEDRSEDGSKDTSDEADDQSPKPELPDIELPDRELPDRKFPA